MTTDATEILTLLAPDSPDTWPQGILAAADEVERMVAEFAEPTSSEAAEATYDPSVWLLRGHVRTLSAGALAAVHHWRGVAGRHVPMDNRHRDCHWCGWHHIWPCPDLTETADDARAYLGGTP